MGQQDQTNCSELLSPFMGKAARVVRIRRELDSQADIFPNSFP